MSTGIKKILHWIFYNCSCNSKSRAVGFCFRHHRLSFHYEKGTVVLLLRKKLHCNPTVHAGGQLSKNPWVNKIYHIIFNIREAFSAQCHCHLHPFHFYPHHCHHQHNQPMSSFSLVPTLSPWELLIAKIQSVRNRKALFFNHLIMFLSHISGFLYLASLLFGPQCDSSYHL